MTALEMATELVNRWISDCLWLAPKEQGIRLIQMVARVIDRIEQEAYERGRSDEKDSNVQDALSAALHE